MKRLLTPLSMIALITMSFSYPSYAEESQSPTQKKAILSCDKLAQTESENWLDWATQRSISKKQLLTYALNMCLNAVVTARDAESINQIEDWQVDAFNRNAYLGFEVLNVNAVQRSASIAKEYFKSLHGEKTHQANAKLHIQFFLIQPARKKGLPHLEIILQKENWRLNDRETM